MIKILAWKKDWKKITDGLSESKQNLTLRRCQQTASVGSPRNKAKCSSPGGMQT